MRNKDALSSQIFEKRFLRENGLDFRVNTQHTLIAARRWLWARRDTRVDNYCGRGILRKVIALPSSIARKSGSGKSHARCSGRGM